MDYISHTGRDISEMLEVIGVRCVDDLFSDIPSSVGLNRTLDLPAPIGEAEALRLAGEIAGKNASPVSLAGAGAYRHHIPAVVDHLASRSEFFTAYTPYQPEVSQGTLVAIFEFQTMICRLTGMDVANASMYDGATSLAEAVFLAARSNSRSTVAVSRAAHPHSREVLRTYCRAAGIGVREIDIEDGVTGVDSAAAALDGEVSALVVQSPNFFGCVEDVGRFAEMAHGNKSFLIDVVTEPLSLAMIKSPGELGADIVCGEGQSFGNPVAFGGPMLGILAARQEFLRRMPGRLVGRTVDADGKEAYALTLQTREQHIRRERATSNICTNEGLCALRAAIYLALNGNSLRELAALNHRIAAYLRHHLAEIGIQPAFSRPYFNEFTIRAHDIDRLRSALAHEGFLLGVPLAAYYPGMEDCALVCATELVTPGDIDRLIALIGHAG